MCIRSQRTQCRTDRTSRSKVSFQHQNEIERMEGLYVRSRQENDKAFRSWLREKRRQAEYEREEQWHQVKVSLFFM